ncbi:MAG TPA: ribonuclease HII, partial [Candidatus Saccharimonadales bacterium]
HAVAFGLGWVSPADIDRQGLTWAVAAAMERALAEVGRGAHKFDRIIIDGNINYLEKNHMVNHTINTMVNTMVRADDNVPAVSAASIIAKVARDHYMTDLGEKYARYGFDKHVGYGTAAHLAALKQFGVCDLHRRSFKPVQALIGGAAI